MTITNPSFLVLYILAHVPWAPTSMVSVPLRPGMWVLQGESVPFGLHWEEWCAHGGCGTLGPGILVGFWGCVSTLTALLEMRIVSSLLPCHFLSRNCNTTTGSTKKKSSWFELMSKPEAFCFLRIYEEKDLPLALLEAALPPPPPC